MADRKFIVDQSGMRYFVPHQARLSGQRPRQTHVAEPSTDGPVPQQDINAVVPKEQIQKVQRLIERCISLYMTENEIITALHMQAELQPTLVKLVWQKMEEQNPEFFRAYHLRLKVKEQVTLFNFLVTQQAQLLRKRRDQNVSLTTTTLAGTDGPSKRQQSDKQTSGVLRGTNSNGASAASSSPYIMGTQPQVYSPPLALSIPVGLKGYPNSPPLSSSSGPAPRQMMVPPVVDGNPDAVSGGRAKRNMRTVNSTSATHPTMYNGANMMGRMMSGPQIMGGYFPAGAGTPVMMNNPAGRGGRMMSGNPNVMMGMPGVQGYQVRQDMYNMNARVPSRNVPVQRVMSAGGRGQFLTPVIQQGNAGQFEIRMAPSGAPQHSYNIPVMTSQASPMITTTRGGPRVYSRGQALDIQQQSYRTADPNVSDQNPRRKRQKKSNDTSVVDRRKEEDEKGISVEESTPGTIPKSMDQLPMAPLGPSKSPTLDPWLDDHVERSLWGGGSTEPMFSLDTGLREEDSSHTNDFFL